MKKTIVKILLNALPPLVMILFVPYIQNDYLLFFVYTLIISALLFAKYERGEYIFFGFGFIVMTFFEWIFVNIGAEIFQRRSLFGIMPIWLPLLWAYSFIAIKRSVVAINSHLNEESR